MTIDELAQYIRTNKEGAEPFLYGNASLVFNHTRKIFQMHRHITDEHIVECCAKALNYDEFIELCTPFAKSDTEAWLKEWNKPPPKGRTKRRFR